MENIENTENILKVNKKDNNFIKDAIFVVVGSFLMAVAIALFLLPNQLSTGGFSGVATIIYYLSNTPPGTTIVILNIPLIIFAYFKLGRKFIIKAIMGLGLLSLFLNYLETLTPLTQDKFLACIYGGIIEGIGTAFILKGSASTGGTDLVTTLIRKYKPELRSSSIIIVFDIIIVALNVVFFKTIEIGLYSAIAIYLESKLVEIIFEGVNFSKVMLIISDKNDEISEAIHNEVQRGTTGLYGKGMYTNEEKTILLCVTSQNEVIAIRKIIESIDHKAFITIMNAREVFGKGFKEDVRLIKK